MAVALHIMKAVAELELGAISVRLEFNATDNLKAVLGQVAMKLSLLKTIKVSPDFEYDELDLSLNTTAMKTKINT